MHCDSYWKRQWYRARLVSAASLGKNLKNILHVVVSAGRRCFWTAAVLTSVQIGRVPVPPVVLSVRFLEEVVTLCRLVKKFCKCFDVRGLCSRRLPLTARSAHRDFLEQPAIPLRILKRSK